MGALGIRIMPTQAENQKKSQMAVKVKISLFKTVMTLFIHKHYNTISQRGGDIWLY